MRTQGQSRTPSSQAAIMQVTFPTSALTRTAHATRPRDPEGELLEADAKAAMDVSADRAANHYQVVRRRLTLLSEQVDVAGRSTSGPNLAPTAASTSALQHAQETQQTVEKALSRIK